MIAIAKKNFQAVCALINMGADLTADDIYTPFSMFIRSPEWCFFAFLWTALHYAAYSGESEIIKMILDFGGDPNTADFEVCFFCLGQRRFTSQETRRTQKALRFL